MLRILPLALLAAACTPMGEPADTPPPANESGAQCDATGIQSLVGRAADPAVAEDARKRAGARTVRQYVTGSPVTMDFRPDRLNVEVDAGGKIVKLGCG